MCKNEVLEETRLKIISRPQLARVCGSYVWK
jgi:hypothetical protein